MKSVSHLFCISSLLVLLPSTVLSGDYAARYTKKLRDVDKVVLIRYKLDEHGQVIDGGPRIPAKSKIITGQEAKTIAALWRSQTYSDGWVGCHYPAYGIEFFSKGSVIMYASICWKCNNIYFLRPSHLKKQKVFEGDNTNGEKLLNLFIKKVGKWNG